MNKVISCNRLKLIAIQSTIIVLFLSNVTTHARTSNTLLRHPKLIEENDDFDNVSSDTTTTVDKNIVLKSFIVRLKSEATIATDSNTSSTSKGTSVDVRGTIDYLMRASTQDGGKVGYVLTDVFKGFTVSGMSNERMKQILDDDNVESASRDSKKSIFDFITQTNAVWNLDILSKPYTDTQYRYNYTGKGVTAYVLDTGIDIQKYDFGGRASCGWDRGWRLKLCLDTNGHGTHVAGTIGGRTYGVAKDVKLVSVKVLNGLGFGLLSTIIAGIDWVVSQKRKYPNKPMLINMSLGGSKNTLENAAVRAATDAGITVVVAAGNDYGADACNKSPASEPTAITVGSVESNENRHYVSYFSNGGPCVDILAPGEDIQSVRACDIFLPLLCLIDISATKSGTSMSSPHVARVAALHLQRNSSLTPNDVWNEIRMGGVTGVARDLYEYNITTLLVNTDSILS